MGFAAVSPALLAGAVARVERVRFGFVSAAGAATATGFASAGVAFLRGIALRFFAGAGFSSA
ncbi:MAG: hypothetical protein WAK80_04695, partial [Candidatus Cybelea sp.]